MRLRRIGYCVAAAIGQWYRSLRKSRQIATLVLFAHAAILLGLLSDHWISARPRPRKPMAVRTLLDEPVAPRICPAPVAKKAAPSQQVAKVTPAAKPSTKPAPQKKKSAAAAPTTKSAPPLQKTLQSIEESFAALSSPAPSVKPAEIALPQLLSFDTEPPDDNASYGEILIGCLQQQLLLPELGSVKAKITLSTPGKISSVEILDAKSAKNAEWLKNQLLLLEAPCFNDFGIKAAAMEFTVTFRNVEDR